MARAVPPGAGLILPRDASQATPNFFCRLVDDVVY